MDELLRIDDLYVTTEEKAILKGLSLTIKEGEVHAVMGPNGSGKSTLVNAIMGNDSYHISKGKIYFMGNDITNMPTEDRARLGIFLGFQYPVELPGIKLTSLLNRAIGAREDRLGYKSLKDTVARIEDISKKVSLDKTFLSRSLNEGFSGGEKKKAEIIQLGVLKPRLAILDEIDSGLDVDALRSVGQVIEELLNGKRGVLIITHYPRILEYVRPDMVHILIDGRIVTQGDGSLIETIEDRGFEPFYGKVENHG